MLTTLLSFAFVLGVLIFVHELGHFVTAKMVGIRVERFSLGFPPRLFGFKRGDTDYCISGLPLGGYVKMSGMIDESLDGTISGEPWEFQSKPVWQRIIVISAGSIMNLVTAVLIYSMLAYWTGVPDKAIGAKINEVFTDTPADRAGLQAADVIIKMNDTRIETNQDLIDIVKANPGNEVILEWRRDGQTLSGTVVPELDDEQQVGVIGIGVGTEVEYRPVGFAESFKFGAIASYSMLKLMAEGFRRIAVGEDSIKDSLGGPILIAKLAGASARQGFENLLAFTAIISLNLGLINMMPFPVLDGGHLVLLLIEGVRRKPLPVKATLVIQKIGMAFLLALMIFVIFNDITRVNNF